MDLSMPMYAMPDTGLQHIDVRAQLASWDAAGHPSQVRLEQFLDEAVQKCGPQLDLLPDPIALRLDVGLPKTTPLLDQHDLDNYLFPLVTRLARTSGRKFASVWGNKRHGTDDQLVVAEAIPMQPDGWAHAFDLRTTASATTTAFKEEIDQQLTEALPLPEGPVRLHIGFVVGPRRQWPNLWKPTIDALGRILGRTSPDRLWHPLDGRIVQLGLSARTDPEIGNDIALRIHAAPANPPTPH
ncbi:hypothetical protein [Actinomadura sp. 3N508]|uniref:hypothetical protein n=1 Tax=Actinomadura sp. 3N508 TaxID=3375153 RepID=UPI003795D8E0